MSAHSGDSDRAKIVAWLREVYALNQHAQEFAAAIERGDYLTEKASPEYAALVKKLRGDDLGDGLGLGPEWSEDQP